MTGKKLTTCFLFANKAECLLLLILIVRFITEK